MTFPRKFIGEEHRAEWLVMVSINCPSRAKEITRLPSSEQTGNGGDELAVQRKFLVIYCYILSFLYLLCY